MNETQENDKTVEAPPEPYPLSWNPSDEGSAFFFGIGVIGETTTVPILGFGSGIDFFQCD